MLYISQQRYVFIPLQYLFEIQTLVYLSWKEICFRVFFEGRRHRRSGLFPRSVLTVRKKMVGNSICPPPPQVMDILVMTNSWQITTTPPIHTHARAREVSGLLIMTKTVSDLPSPHLKKKGWQFTPALSKNNSVQDTIWKKERCVIFLD